MENVFNVRIYGLLINDCKEVMISDEEIAGKQITKFPGGGLEFGEGTRDCLKREFLEELNLEITVKHHFYTTDFFQPSFFNVRQQVISIYYFVESFDLNSLVFSQKPFNFNLDNNDRQSIRWLSIAMAKENDLTFPIDRKVMMLLKDYFKVS